MKTFTAIILVSSLMATSAFAETTLKAGKPAGLKNAQAASQNALLIIAGVGLVGVGIGIAASSNGKGTLSATTTTSP